MARADRTSEHLTAQQVDSLWKATYFAASQGIELNTFVTVHWQNLPDGGPSIQHWQGKWLELVHKWLKRRGLPLTCVWAIERGQTAGGLHSHVLIHLPWQHRMDFCAMLPAWTGIEASAKQLKGRTAARAIDGQWQVDRVKSGTQQKLLRYMLKGFPGFAGTTTRRGETVQRRLYNITHQPQGLVTGKRCGTSNNIGPTARKRWKEANADMRAAA